MELEQAGPSLHIMSRECADRYANFIIPVHNYTLEVGSLLGGGGRAGTPLTAPVLWSGSALQTRDLTHSGRPATGGAVPGSRHPAAFLLQSSSLGHGSPHFWGCGGDGSSSPPSPQLPSHGHIRKGHLGVEGAREDWGQPGVPVERKPEGLPGGGGPAVLGRGEMGLNGWAKAERRDHRGTGAAGGDEGGPAGASRTPSSCRSLPLPPTPLTRPGKGRRGGGFRGPWLPGLAGARGEKQAAALSWSHSQQPARGQGQGEGCESPSSPGPAWLDPGERAAACHACLAWAVRAVAASAGLG